MSLLKSIVFSILILIPKNAVCQKANFKTTIDYYLIDEECRYPKDTFQRNGLPEFGRTYIEPIKNDLFSTDVDFCEGLPFLLYKALEKGDINAYSIDNGKQLMPKELDILLKTEMYDVCNGATFNVSNIDNLRLYRITQEWQILENYAIQNKILSIIVIEVKEDQSQKELFEVRFDNGFVEDDVLNDVNITYVVLGQEKIVHSKFNQEKLIFYHFKNEMVMKYNCKEEGLFRTCPIVTDPDVVNKIITNSEGIVLHQFFFFNKETNSLNSKYVSMSMFDALYGDQGEFKYFDHNLWLKNRN